MTKELKGILRNAEKGITILDACWEAYIDLPSRGGSIAVYRTNKYEAVKIREIILNALHAYGKEEDPEAYREVQQPIPHEAERILWKAQREAGTNEVWQWENMKENWLDLLPNEEPQWVPGHKYRVKPKPTKLTAKIIRKSILDKALFQSFEFVGTPEEFRAECEKYGYAVVSEIKEVVEKLKTVTHYFALVIGRLENGKSKVFAVCGLDKEQLENSLVGCSIVGDIEEREVEV